MTFAEYCISKKIDPAKFKAGDYRLWTELESIFGLMHPNSFTAQKKFLINGTRRRFLLDIIAETEKEVPKNVAPKIKIPGVKTIAKPAIKPAIPTSNTTSTTEKPKKAALKPKIGGSTIPKPAALKPNIKATSALKPKIGGASSALRPKINTANKATDETTQKSNALKPKIGEAKPAAPKSNALKPKIGAVKTKSDSSETPSTEKKKPSALKPIIRPKKDEEIG